MRKVLAVAAAGMLLAACGGGSRGTPPAGANEVVLRVVTRGGFAAGSRQRSQLPPLSVLGDALVITLGPTTLEFPGPALPNLQEFRLTREGLARVVDDARDAGLLDDPRPDYGNPGITDQATTTVTMHVGNRARRVNVYALGFSDGLTAEQRENRARLERLIQRVGDPDALRPFIVPGTEHRYQPTAVAVSVSPAETTGGTTHPWPLGDLSVTDCTVYDGADAATVLAAARTANEGDTWEASGATYRVAFRPLLPDERTCDDVTGR